MKNSDTHMLSVDSIGWHAGDAVNDSTPITLDEPLAVPLTIPRAEVTALIAALEQLHQRLPIRSFRGAIMRLRRRLAPSA